MQQSGLTLLFQSTGCRREGSIVVVPELSCSATWEIFPDQGSNPCPLHCQADSSPLDQQRSQELFFTSCSVQCSKLYRFCHTSYTEQSEKPGEVLRPHESQRKLSCPSPASSPQPQDLPFSPGGSSRFAIIRHLHIHPRL